MKMLFSIIMHQSKVRYRDGNTNLSYFASCMSHEFEMNILPHMFKGIFSFLFILASNN